MGQKPRLLPAGLFITVGFLYLLAPTSANKCIVGCHGMQASKGYDEGHTYTYEYEGTSVTSVSEAQGESSVKVNAIVELAVKPDCVRQLKLKNVRVNGTPLSQQDVEKYALQFNYHNGHIDTGVCSEAGDSQASLNIKRAIASLFQSAVMQENGVTTHRETDVFGSCQTDFEFRREGDSLTVRKYRNLADCSHRENIRHGLIYAAFDDNSSIKSSPVIDSQQKIEQIFKKGILNSAKSTETYNLRMFSNGEAGAKTIVQSTLIFKSEKQDGAAAAPVSVPKSLIFEAPHPVVQSSVEAITEALKAVKTASGPDAVKDKAADTFGEFIKVLRRSNKKDILNAYRRVRTGTGGFDKNSDRKILLDGLFRCGSGEAAEVAVELIENKELTDLQILGYYASLALVDHVQLPAVVAVSSLSNQPNIPRIGYLGIGRVIGKYCSQHECENVPAIEAALGKIVKKIGNGKPGSRAGENDVIAAMKALRNAQYLDEKTIETLVNIVKDKSVHDRVRVAAIEAFPSKCSMKWKKPIMEVFGDREEDSEIRIKSYLSLAACPCSFVANGIKEIIDKETVNQVGSFVTTHLRNLRASTDPSKESAKRHLGEIRVPNKFPEDFRKFSFNREFSYDIRALGVGSSAEQNVIFSQKSWIPRSTSLNLTTEIFGRSFNFLEVDTRVENLDRLIEHFFGPKGVLKSNEISSMFSNSKESFSNIYDHFKERAAKTGRGKRSISQSELDNFAKNAKPRESEVDEKLDLDLSVKMFGTELFYLDLQETGETPNPNSVIDKVFDLIDKALNKAKNFDYTGSNHMHFMDVDLIYPTGLGFPLSIGIEGNGVTHLRANGKIDLPAIIKDPKNAAIKIGLEPSVSVTISSNLVIDSFGIESGLKVIGRLHTATGSELTVKILEGNGIDVNFGIPKRKQELISVSSDVLFIDPSGKKSAPKFAKGREHSDCFDQLSVILGLTVCGDFAYPYDTIESVAKKPVFPLSGPSKFAISIENNDATSYHFRAFYDKSKDTSRSLEILFETPNSRNNRKVAIKVEGVNEPTQKYIKASFDSPVKKAEGELRLENTDKKKTLTLSLKHDSDMYYGSVGLVANGNKYQPILEYKVPDHVEHFAGSKGSKGAPKAAYKVEGDIVVNDENSGTKYNFENVALLAAGKKLVSLNGWVFAGPGHISADTKLTHNDENIQAKLDLKRSDTVIDIKLGIVPSKDKNLGFKLSWVFDKKENQVTENFIFVYGPDLDSKVNRFSYISKISFKKNEKPAHPYQTFSELKTETKMTWPAQDYELKADFEVSPSKLDSGFEFKYGTFTIGSDLQVKSDEENRNNFDFGWRAYVLENKILIEVEQKMLSDHKRKLEGKVEFPGAKYEAEVTINHQVEGPIANIQFDGDFKINGKELKLNYGLDANSQKINSNALLDLQGTKYLEFSLKIARGPNPTGNLNLNVKNILIVGGDFKYKEGNGNALIEIDMPNLKRKIKGVGKITVLGPKHVATIDILLDAERDPSKRITIGTDTDISKGSFSSENGIDIFGYKMGLNTKGTLQEKPNRGYQFDGEFDVTLPDGKYIAVNGKQSVDRKSEKTDVHGQYEINYHEKKGASGRKLQYNYDLILQEPKGSEFSGKHVMKFVNVDGKDAEIIVASKHVSSTENAEKRRGELQVSASGSYLPRKFDFDFVTDYTTKKTGSWKLNSKLGDDFEVKGTGSLAEGTSSKDQKVSDVKLEMKLPSEKLRNLKYEGSANVIAVDGDVDMKTSHGITWNDDKTVKGELQFKKSKFEKTGVKDVSVKVILNVLSNPQISVATSMKHDSTQDLKKGNGKVVINYGDKEVSIETDAAYLQDLTDVKFDVKATTPVDKFKNIEFGVVHKREKDGPLKYNARFIADEKKYEMSSEFEINPSVHRVSINFNCPAGVTELFAKVNKISDNEFKGEWKINTPKGFVVADGHVVIESVDNFNIIVNFDSDKFEPRKIHAEISTQPAVKTGKKIVLSINSEGKNIITGSTNYNKRDEAGKIIVEGTGSLKIGENTRSSKFTYSRQQLTKENDGEAGVAILLNANFGPSAVVGELKLSDKEVHVFNSYCEQSKDCAHFKLQSTIDTKEPRVDHQITVEVDLKKFNVPVEFGLKTTTIYDKKELTFDHTANLYLHTSKDKTEYSSQIYVQPKGSAVILILPSRELALIASFDVPKGKTPMGTYKIDLSAYLDRKNHPKEKTSFVAAGDVNIEKNTASISGEASFSYPKQTKDMIVKGNLHYGGEHLLDASVDIDVFAKKAQKIGVVARLIKSPINKGYNVTGVLEVNSHGQQLKVNLKQHFAISALEIGMGSFLSYTDLHQKPKSVGFLFALDPKEIYILVQAPNKMLIKSETAMEFSSNLQKIDTEYSLLENPPVIISIEAKDMNSFKYQSYQKDKPNTKLQATGRVVLGQLAEFHADSYKEGDKKPLLSVAIYLDESRFLKPNFVYNKENVNALMDFYREKLVKHAEQLKEITKGLTNEAGTEFKDLFDHLKKAQPNLSPMIEYYQGELEKLKQELDADRTIKAIQVAVNKIFGGLIYAIIDTIKEVTEKIGDLQKQFHEIQEKILEAVKVTYPKIKESIDIILHSAVEIVDAASKLGVTYLKAILNVINDHQKELKELATAVNELVQDIVKIIMNGVNQVEGEVKNFVSLTVQQIKALPIYDILKEKWNEIVSYQVPDAVLVPIEEAFAQLKKILPTEELREFFTVTYNYIIKHIKRQKVDDPSEIKNIYTHGIEAIQSIIDLIQNRATSEQIYSLLGAKMGGDLGYLKYIPGIPILKVSIINLIKNREIPSITDIYHAYRPTAHISDIVPPFSKSAIIVEGGHFFTFDGKHLTLAGSCDYVLAQDTKDGNFSIIGTLNAGKLISVTITAPNESITLKSNGNILVDNAPAEYPASTKNLHAFVTPPIVNVKSDYGVHVACSQKAPMICSVRVSGFYHGKIRGIFGDADNEPWDDFTLPNGHVAESESEFGNSYRLDSKCPAAPAVDHHTHNRDPTCTEYFAGSSSLSSCFSYVNPSDFRTACDHAVSAGTPRAACIISAAYFVACRSQRVSVSIPSACSSCKNGKDEISIGDTFSVKIPKKEADIVFVVEQEIKNEPIFKELITQLITEVKTELKSRGITDIQIGLIGFGEHMKWPQHYTTGGSINIEGDIKNMKFEQGEPLITLEEAKGGNTTQRLKYAKQRLNVELGTFKLTGAYEEAIQYPFRSGAAKAVVGVLASPCEKSPLPISLQHLRLILGQKIYRDLGLTYYHVGFMDDLLSAGKPQKNVVGYDSESAYSFADSKKKPLEGSVDRDSLGLPSDVCARFAAASGGAAFSSNNFLEGKQSQKKQFIQVAARRMADGITNIEFDEDCTCKQHHGLDGQARCKIVARKELESSAKHTKGGVKA